MVGKYQTIMEKHVEPCMKGLTKKGQQQVVDSIESLGLLGLSTSIAISKALVENYFLNDKLSQPIIELLDKSVEVQRIAEEHKLKNPEEEFE